MMKIIKSMIAFLIVAFCVGIGGCFAAAYINSAPDGMETKDITIRQGDSVKSVASMLKRENLIRSDLYFDLMSRWRQVPSIKTGNYTIQKDSSSVEILDKIARGEIKTRKITIPEGSNLYQIAELLEKEDICGEKPFLKAAENRTYLKSIGINSPTAEGYLFPETYYFAESTDPKQVILFLYGKMKEQLVDLGYDANKNALDVHKVLILASLVEKEAKVKDEQKRIASVFFNRIKNDMRFDSDPTVRYATGKFTGSITVSDLEYDSPYNTYVHKGFTPTPIACPGRTAIAAVLDPDNTDFLYFVARNDGTHYFSESLSRHNRAVEFYQRGINNGFSDEQR